MRLLCRHPVPVVEITSGHWSISERFFKLTAHYSKWSVRVTDHMFMVAQQLYSQRNTRRKAGHLFQHSLLVNSAVLSVSLIELRLCGLLALSFTMKRGSVSQEGAVDAKKRREVAT